MCRIPFTRDISLFDEGSRRRYLLRLFEFECPELVRRIRAESPHGPDEGSQGVISWKSLVALGNKSLGQPGKELLAFTSRKMYSYLDIVDRKAGTTLVINSILAAVYINTLKLVLSDVVMTSKCNEIIIMVSFISLIIAMGLLMYCIMMRLEDFCLDDRGFERKLLYFVGLRDRRVFAFRLAWVLDCFSAITFFAFVLFNFKLLFIGNKLTIVG